MHDIDRRSGMAGRGRAGWRLVRAALLAALALWPLAACRSLDWTTTPRLVDLSETSVPLQIAKDPTGSVLALLSITIQDQGPFTFVLDTGASRSVIDRKLADQLQLETVPAIPVASGISGTVQATVVRVSKWSAGDTPLPETVMAAIDLSGSSGPLLDQLLGQHMDGLLGSDVLSSFGAVTVDYSRSALILAPGS